MITKHDNMYIHINHKFPTVFPTVFPLHVPYSISLTCALQFPTVFPLHVPYSFAGIWN